MNGSTGIAVGMATNIPPHNLGEVVSACIALIDDSSLTVDELMQYLPGPDFPTRITSYNVCYTKLLRKGAFFCSEAWLMASQRFIR